MSALILKMNSNPPLLLKLATIAGGSGSGSGSGFGALTAVTADRPLLAADSGARFNNLGAVAGVEFELPASAGLTLGWFVMLRVFAAQNMHVVPQGSDTLRNFSSTPAYIESAVPGSILVVEYQGGGVFMITDQFGDWSSP